MRGRDSSAACSRAGDLGGRTRQTQGEQRAAQRAPGRRPHRGDARGDLQMADRLLDAAETRQQTSEREASPRGLVAGLTASLAAIPLTNQPLVDEAGLAQRTGPGLGARLIERRSRAAVPGRGPGPGAGPLRRARRLEGPAARGEGLGHGEEPLGRRRFGDLGGLRRQVRVQRQPHRQRPVAQRQRQRPGVREAPDPLVERDGARQLPTPDGSARRLGVGAVRHQIVDEVAVRHGRLPCSHSSRARVRSIDFCEQT